MKYFFTLIVLFTSTCASAQTIYVTKAGSGLKNGTSWANAWGETEFGNNLYAVPPGSHVWVGKGSYIPTKDVAGSTPSFQSNATFKIPSGVKLFGGFAGTENILADRDMSKIHSDNETILTGEIGVPNDHGDNIFIVVQMTAANSDETLDGFTVSHALSQGINLTMTSTGASPLIKNCVIRENSPMSASASGIGVSGNGLSTSANISNCFFFQNFGFSAGALAASNCNLLLSNSVFVYNSSSNGIYASCVEYRDGAAGQINNCTFFQNGLFSGNLHGPVIRVINAADSLLINNSIFWENRSENSVFNLEVTGTNRVAVRNSIFQSQTHPDAVAPALMRSVISADPLFVNSNNTIGVDNFWGTADDGLKLTSTSPAVDRGLNEYISAIATRDAEGMARIKGCRVDIGAFEYQDNSYDASGLYNGNAQTCTQYPVGSAATMYIDTVSCHPVTSISPSGANPVSGIVQTCVLNTPSVQFHNGIPYVQRYYDITPQNNASTATANITLFYTQADFDNYNAASGSFPKLPTGPGDAAGIANVVIEQDHGFSLTGVPGTYSGSTVLIDPDDNNIVWNATNQVWEISFAVDGFSGFFLRTNMVASAPSVTVVQPDCNIATGTITITDPVVQGNIYSIGGSYQSSPVFENLAPGNYSVTVMDADSVVSPATPVTITASPVLPAIPVISGPANVCGDMGTGEAITYSVEPVDGATNYYWIVPPSVSIVNGQGTSSIDVMIPASFANAANKRLRVTVETACGISPESLISLKTQKPQKPGMISASSNDICAAIDSSSDIIFTIPSTASATSYTWTAQDGTTTISHINGAGVNDTAVSILFTNGFTSSYINVVANNPCGSSDARRIFITKNIPTIPGTISGPVNVCENLGPDGTQATYTIPLQDGITLYNWNLPAGATSVSGQGTNTISFNYPQAYSGGSISVSAVNGCGESAHRMLRTSVLQPGAPGSILTEELEGCPARRVRYYLSSMPLNATAVNWTVPATSFILSGQGTNSIEVFHPGSSSGVVSAIASSNCGSSSARTLNINVVACRSSEAITRSSLPQTIDGADEFSVVLFPNPAIHQVNIRVQSGSKEQVYVRVMDMQGKMLSGKNSNPASLIQIGEDLKPGMYFIEVLQGKNRKVMKFIKR